MSTKNIKSAKKGKPKAKPQIIAAAGAVISRRTADGHHEVCLVHRNRYDDWSFPKGKLDAHESAPHAAIREIGEETGLDIKLTAYLTTLTYPLHLDGSEGKRAKKNEKSKHTKHKTVLKQVSYWNAHLIDPEQATARESAFGLPIHRDAETDEVIWLTPKAAYKKLSYANDRNVLDTYEKLLALSDDKIGTVIIVRHGKAESRKTWIGNESNRPLTPAGSGGSFALMRELACYAPSEIFSSPWRRCVQTIAPYATASNLKPQYAAELTEETAAATPQTSIDFVKSYLKRASQLPHTTTILCSHRHVFYTVFPDLKRWCISQEIADKIPAENPSLDVSEALVLNVIDNDGTPQIVGAQVLQPITY